MKKILILTFILLLQLVHATTLTTTKPLYSTEDTITLQFNDMTGLNKDWIAIYPETSNNDWENVMRWSWTDDNANGNLTFNSLPQGNYEARAFYNNSYITEASTKFIVSQQGEVKLVQVETVKNTYKEDEAIQVRVENMLGHPKDWIAIYHKGSTNEWKNVLQWNWTEGQKDTILEFHGLKTGEYEVRAFFENSYTDQAKHEFSVISSETSNDTSLFTNADYYTTEDIRVEIKGFNKNQKDWVGIYPKGSSNASENIIIWKWVDDAGGNYLNFKTLPIGEYEARGFFKNSFHLEAKKSFTVLERDINKQALIEQAKTYCLENDNSTSTTLCANDKNTVYILKREDLNHIWYFNEFKILLNNESVEILSSETVGLNRQGLKNDEIYVSKFEHSPIYITQSEITHADPHGYYNIHSEDKIVFNLLWHEAEGIIQENTLEVSEDGTKLNMERTFSNRQARYIEVYDISNPDDIKLFSREIIDVPRII